ncbi:hypothetical protein RFI_21698 [Reticulomyxa filosa]|uniref:Uncharacterized protein n=1 Tax=Reticulomyxa filosa TaxID=46433 RepID=X6MRC8_RETFI|nr:hypothetical protein RFI_21698 [Reticulomyxa filosa]|eukprot:ETO15665.1 hypothetical protein RFI_21698 [Reticulomyxa filosa]
MKKKNVQTEKDNEREQYTKAIINRLKPILCGFNHKITPLHTTCDAIIIASGNAFELMYHLQRIPNMLSVLQQRVDVDKVPCIALGQAACDIMCPSLAMCRNFITIPVMPTDTLSSFLHGLSWIPFQLYHSFGGEEVETPDNAPMFCSKPENPKKTKVRKFLTEEEVLQIEFYQKAIFVLCHQKKTEYPSLPVIVMPKGSYLEIMGTKIRVGGANGVLKYPAYEDTVKGGTFCFVPNDGWLDSLFFHKSIIEGLPSLHSFTQIFYSFIFLCFLLHFYPVFLTNTKKIKCQHLSIPKKITTNKENILKIFLL